MVENSKIGWTDHTFNPWQGCKKISPGCNNCYAEARAKRFGNADLWHNKRRRTKTWNDPVKWNKRAAAEGKRYKVFCASLADVFDNQAPQEWRNDLWKLVKATPNLDWQILTKRISNAKKMLPDNWGDGYPNVWLLITVVNQEEVDRDIPKLMDIPAVIHGLSIEPQLGEIDLIGHLDSAIDWVICGCESGPNARPFNPQWAGYLMSACWDAGVSFFYKQSMENGKLNKEPMIDGKMYLEFPQ